MSAVPRRNLRSRLRFYEGDISVLGRELLADSLDDACDQSDSTGFIRLTPWDCDWGVHLGLAPGPPEAVHLSTKGGT